EVKMDVIFKHSRIKQYLKQGRAYRIETVINKPADLGIPSRLPHLPELVAKARAINHRLLMIEQAGQGCAIGPALFERTTSPAPRRANEPEHCASGIIAPWHWPAPCASSSTPPPASPAEAFAGTSPDSSAPTTRPAR